MTLDRDVSNITDSQFNLEAKCSQPKKKDGKRKLKDMDAPINIHVDTSVLKGDSVGTNSCHDSLVEINAKTDSGFAAQPVLSKSKRMRMTKRKKEKFNSSGITNEVTVSLADLDLTGTEENALIPEKQSDSPRSPSAIIVHKQNGDAALSLIGTNSCHDSLVEINAKTDSEFAAQPVLTRSQRKRMRMRNRQKEKFNSSGITNEVTVSLADLDFPGTEENALIPEKQNDSPRSPSAIIVHKQNGEAALSLIEKDNTKKKRTRRKRKKQNTSVINDNAHHSHADLDVVGMERHGLLSQKQSDTRNPSVNMVEKHDNDDEKRKKKQKRKRNKQKLNTSVITDKAHVSPAELDIEVEENASISEKQSDSSRSPSSTVNKHNHNDPASAFLLDERENVKIKRKKKKQKVNTSVITDKVHVPLAELDRSEEENALIYVKESNSPSTPSSNHDAARILVEKENTKTNRIEGKLRSHRRKRRKSSNSEEVMVPTRVAGQASTDSDEVHSTKISDNEVKRVQAGKVAASVNVVGNVLEAEIKKSTVLNVSVEKHNFQQVAHPLVGAPVGYADKKLLILDVNGLLADIVPHVRNADITISKKSVFKRPFCDDFLQFCFEKFNVGVWSSRIKRNVDQVVNFLMADSRHKLLFCWDQSHCTDTGFTTVENNAKPLVLKELKKLWDKLEPGLPWNKGDYNESNTLLLDDSPYKALCNPANTAIFPYSYSYKDAGDSSLGPGGDLRVYLEKLAEAQNVQEFIAHNPFGQRAITDRNPTWGFYQRIVRHEFSKKIARSAGPSYTGNS